MNKLDNESSKNEILQLVRSEPYRIANEVGFLDIQEYPHNEWMLEILYGEDEEYTLMAHRGSYKSSCLSVCIALIMVLFPEDNIIFLRKADNDVTEMLRMVKKALESRFFQNFVSLYYDRPLILAESSSSSITTNLYCSASGASQLIGIGLKSSITGKHANIVITDDICNVNDRISRAERERTNLQYQELQNICNRGGRIINLGTKWHNEDVFTLMNNIHTYDYKKTKLISSQKIAYLKKKMLPSLFACNYELKIIASEDIIFRDPRTGAETRLALNGFMQVDCAYDGEDYTAMTICHKTEDKYYIFGKMWRKHCLECENEIDRYYKQFLCTAVYNEKNADKGMYAQKLRARGMHVIGYDESQNKYMKIATYLLDEWENVYFCEGTDKAYIDQICEYNIEADHDDAPDSLASAVRVKWHKQSNYIPIWNK